MTRTPKTKEQIAVEDLDRATRVAERALKTRDRTKAAADKAETIYVEAEASRAFLATNPFLPATPAPRRPRAPRQQPTTGGGPIATNVTGS